MTRIIRLQVDNVKKIRAVNIMPPSNLVVIGGRNDQGKSSILDSIAWVLGGAKQLPEQPVREGEKGARIIAELDDLVVTRTITAAGGGGLTVKSKDGATYGSPQAILDKLTGKLSFDPLAFTLLKSDAQVEALKKLVGLDFTEEDGQRLTLYNDRTTAGRQLEEALALFNTLPQHPNTPAELIDVAAVVAEFEAAQKNNLLAQELGDKADRAREAVIDAQQEADMADANFADARKFADKLAADLISAEDVQLKSQVLADACTATGICNLTATQLYQNILAKVSEMRGKLDASPNELARLEKVSAEKKAALIRAQTASAEAEKAAIEAQIIDLEPISQKLKTAEATNANVRANLSKEEKRKEVESLRAKVQELTSAIEHIDAGKKAKLAAAKFPVPGLSFGDKGVIYDGVPFAQASSAVKIKVSVAMAIALNPTLKVMLIRDGSLLDDESLALIGQLAFEHDAQVWVERVGKGAECSVIIEEGRVFTPDPETGEDDEDRVMREEMGEEGGAAT
jgi:hypothetical protein